MCISMVDIQSPTAEIRRGKKRKIEERNYRMKIYMVSLLHRATIKKAVIRAHSSTSPYWNRHSVVTGEQQERAYCALSSIHTIPVHACRVHGRPVLNTVNTLNTGIYRAYFMAYFYDPVSTIVSGVLQLPIISPQRCVTIIRPTL